MSEDQAAQLVEMIGDLKATVAAGLAEHGAKIDGLIKLHTETRADYSEQQKQINALHDDVSHHGRIVKGGSWLLGATITAFFANLFRK